MSQPRSVTLNIAGETLSLKTDRDETILQELASEVSEKVLELKRHAPGVPSHRIYLLVALQLADELHAERETVRDLCDEVNVRSSKLLSLVETELTQLPQP